MLEINESFLYYVKNFKLQTPPKNKKRLHMTQNIRIKSISKNFKENRFEKVRSKEVEEKKN